MMNAMTDVVSPMLALGLPNGSEWIILLVLGLLIFGRRLPEVGRSIGKGIVEFKKGIKGIDDEIEENSSQSSKPSARPMLDQPESEPAARLTRDRDDADYVPAARRKAEKA